METITKITLQGLYSIELKIAGAAGWDRFILKDVDGLGPPERDISIADGFYQGTKVLSRELEFKVGLNPEYVNGERAVDLRREIYGLLTNTQIDDHINITLHGTTRNYYAKGWVKRCVPVPFAKDPEVMITMPCENPLLLGEKVTYTTETIPEHPVELYVFNLPYIGTAPAGWTLRSKVLLNTFNFGPLQWPNYETRMQTSESVQSNDIVTFNSSWHDRSMTRTRSGVDTDISGTLNDLSTWMQLKPGDNWFEMVSVIEEASYVPTYWGI